MVSINHGLFSTAGVIPFPFGEDETQNSGFCSRTYSCWGAGAGAKSEEGTFNGTRDVWHYL